MSKRKVIATASIAILTIGSAYYLFAVRCLGRIAQEQPKPYDVARYEVYSVVLDDVRGKALLIQNDTRALLGFGFDDTPSVVTDPPANDARSQAITDYKRRPAASALAVEPRFQISKTYGFVSSDKITVWMRQSPLHTSSVSARSVPC